MEIRVLRAADVDRALSMSEAVEVNARAYARLSAGEADAPQRLALETPKGVALFMPAIVRPEGALAIKVVSFFGGNPQRGLPALHALVLVIDSETGAFLALLDGARLTALRTGAGAGAATRLLARPDARIMALFGAGGQAADQARAVLAVRPIEELRIYTPSGLSARALAEKLSREFPGLAAQAVETPAEAVRGADIISCATTSTSPVFDPADVSPGTHINGVGSFTPGMREVQVAGLNRLRIFVDSRQAALAEAGDLIQAIAEERMRPEALTEIGSVVTGAAAGRSAPEEITFFKSVGVAVQDAMTAHAVLQRAAELGLGTAMEI